jgi:hypothetical protein
VSVTQQTCREVERKMLAATLADHHRETTNSDDCSSRNLLNQKFWLRGLDLNQRPSGYEPGVAHRADGRFHLYCSGTVQACGQRLVHQK